MHSGCVSLNEIEATCKKSLRGVGYSWGLADEGAQSNKWMVNKGIASIDSLLHLLEKQAKQQLHTIKPNRAIDGWCASTECLCPILTACTAADFFPICGLPAYLRNVVYPLQMIGFFGMLAERQQITITAQWQGAAVVLNPNSHTVFGEEIYREMAQEIRLTTCASSCISDGSLQALQHYASMACVPTSDASRANAGAGTSDND